MKYLKTYEFWKDYVNVDELIIGNMYLENMPVCYIGHNGADFPRLFLLFDKNNNDNFYFIDWYNGIQVTDMNMTINDYIIQNNIVNDTLKSIKRKNFSSGPSGTDSKLINNLYRELLKDDRIKILVDSEKYNL